MISPGATMGDNAVIGPGSVVARDVPAGSTARGNPAASRSYRARSETRPLESPIPASEKRPLTSTLSRKRGEGALVARLDGRLLLVRAGSLLGDPVDLGLGARIVAQKAAKI